MIDNDEYFTQLLASASLYKNANALVLHLN